MIKSVIEGRGKLYNAELKKYYWGTIMKNVELKRDTQHICLG